MMLRFAAGQVTAGLMELEAIHQEFNPAYPLEYSFLDDRLDAYHAEQEVVGTLSRAFAGIALLVACLGLLALAAFTIQERKKEIGVRKVLGASKSGIMVTLSRELVGLILFSLLLTLPAAYYAMDGWLDTFAYRVDLSIATLVVAAALTITAAVVTIAWQAFQATRDSPASLLKHE